MEKKEFTTVTQAENWFLLNSSGQFLAIDINGQERLCDNYFEAKRFLENALTNPLK